MKKQDKFNCDLPIPQILKDCGKPPKTEFSFVYLGNTIIHRIVFEIWKQFMKYKYRIKSF